MTRVLLVYSYKNTDGELTGLVMPSEAEEGSNY